MQKMFRKWFGTSELSRIEDSPQGQIIVTLVYMINSIQASIFQRVIYGIIAPNAKDLALL